MTKLDPQLRHDVTDELVIDPSNHPVAGGGVAPLATAATTGRADGASSPTSITTRSQSYLLTVAASVLFIGLTWIFADDQFSGNWWNGLAIASSNVFTYVLLALIIAAGLVQAQRLPADGGTIRTASDVATPGQVDEPLWWKLLLGNADWAILWLPLRFFVGRDWLVSGEAKLRTDAWMDGGAALKRFWQSAVATPEQGRPGITYGWFRNSLQYMLDHGWYSWFAKLIAISEFLVGVGLVLGALVGIAAFAGTLMNFNYELAGPASTNPVLFGLGVFIVLGWKVAGWWGLDRWLLPMLGTPWRRGRVFAPAAAAPAMPGAAARPHELATVGRGADGE